MAIHPKLAYEIYFITFVHLFSLICLFTFSYTVYLRSRKDPLLYLFLSVSGCIGLWMFAKILKTVSPSIELRWLFILLQYIGIDYLGYFLLIFALTYRTKKIPSKTTWILLAILPTASFLVILTNPFHYHFYSYFDFYKDYFGILFYIAQGIQYIYWIAGVIILSKGFTKQPSFKNQQMAGHLFAFITLLPVSINIYYILFKLNLLEWYFPFPVFDITPIFAGLGIILFMIPALKFRFFDIRTFSYPLIFANLPDAMCFFNTNHQLTNSNLSFQNLHRPKELLDKINFNLEGIQTLMHHDSVYDVLVSSMKHHNLFILMKDVTLEKKQLNLVAEKNRSLSVLRIKLEKLKNNKKELAVTQAKLTISQNIHDILGHSLTVVLGTLELASMESPLNAKEKLILSQQLLSTSLTDIKNSFVGADSYWQKTSLITAIEQLKNPKIKVDFSISGKACELNAKETEAIFRLCQEAMTNAIKHGQAEMLHIILRYHPNDVEIFTLDNGLGCENISKNFGLSGIEERFQQLNGNVNFQTEPNQGFRIHGTLPISSHV
ncbi:MAG: hypothetical protein JXR88_18775 [Clostridia bacterium]|nr:hypothetical protein [Clostridia bacterium]